MPLCPSPELETADWFPLRWQLPSTLSGLQGQTPLPWCSSGWYAGALRQQVLQLRRDPRAAALAPWLEPLLHSLGGLAPWPSQGTVHVVPIPSGRSQPNRVPQLLAEALLERLTPGPSWQLSPALLQRSHRLMAQHHLGRRQRWRNQWLSFRALLAEAADPAVRPASGTVLLVDDVLTSGATALAAQHALQAAGWPVAGLACLARTPRSGRGRA